MATGIEFVEEAKISVRTLKKEMPGLEATIITNVDKKPKGFDKLRKLNEPTLGFRDKIKGIRKTPYENTLFLDTDTYVKEPVDELFRILEKFDIAATHNQNRDIHTSNLGVPKSFPEYNTGVIAFKRSKTKNLFKNWIIKYDKKQHSDQPSFRKVLYESNLRIATLTREYNYSARIPAHLVKPVKVFHGRMIDISDGGANRYYDMKKVINRIENKRGHKLVSRGGYKRGINPPLIRRILISIREKGFWRTIHSIFKGVMEREIEY